MRDLETMRSGILNAEIRPLYDEAVRAYQAGAFKSAIIAVWIGVVADLTSKVRHLSETGDGRAKSAIADLDRAIAGHDVRGMQRFENEVLTLVGDDLQILTRRECDELKRLAEDRNLCAHPGFLETRFVPTGELARTHIVAAWDSVFSQEALAGKHLVDVLLEEIQGDSWPSWIGIREYLDERYFRRSKDSVRSNLISVLVKGSVRPENGNLVARRCRESVAATADLHPVLLESRMSAVLSNWEKAGGLKDRDLVRAVGALGNIRAFWVVLPGTARTRLLALVPRCDTEFLIEERFFASGVPCDSIAAGVYERAIDKVNIDQLEELVKPILSQKQWVGRALKIVGEATSYRGAERRLRILEHCSAYMTADDVATLKKHILENYYDQIRKASETENILISMVNQFGPRHEILDAWEDLANALRDKAVEDAGESGESLDDVPWSYDLLSNAIASSRTIAS